MSARDSKSPAVPESQGAARGYSWEPFKKGNTVNLTHGGTSPRLVGPLSEELRADLAAMVEGTPAGAPQFALALGALATKLARLQLVSTWLADNGPIDDDGEVRGAAKWELELLSSIEKSLDALGLTPTTAARLGVDLVRGVSITDEMDRARQIRAEAEDRLGKDKGQGQGQGGGK